MPTKNPRINVVCEQPLFYELNAIAESQSTSVSSLVHDLTTEALELREDRVLVSLADSRAATFDRTQALSFDQVFGK